MFIKEGKPISHRKKFYRRFFIWISTADKPELSWERHQIEIKAGYIAPHQRLRQIFRRLVKN
jgi:hypothetical protein